MEKKITIISSTFYPDIGPGAIRTTLMLEELIKFQNISITIHTQEPNRYNDYLVDDYLKKNFKNKNLKIIRYRNRKLLGLFKIKIYSYILFFFSVLFSSQGKKPDILWATSSRFFTLLLACLISKNKKTKLYLDIRDLFIHNAREIYKNKFYKIALFLLKIYEKKIISRAQINIISPGFKFYFDKYKISYTSYYHGIPEIFYHYHNQNLKNKKLWENKTNKILYVGNIGEGQGMHILIPDLAKINPKLNITIIGAGKFKKIIKQKMIEENLINIKLINPIRQIDLINHYQETDFLLLNLNAYKAFKYVMPSKIFEYSIFKKPILCGTEGISKDFISQNIDKSFFFKPNDAKGLNKILLTLFNKKLNIERDEFINNSRYRNIIANYAKFIMKN